MGTELLSAKQPFQTWAVIFLFMVVIPPLAAAAVTDATLDCVLNAARKSSAARLDKQVH